MGVELLTKRHASQIAGVPGCYDRLLIFGTLPGICYAGGMTAFLYAREVRIFDYPKFAEPYRERIRENAESMAAAASIEIEFIRSRSIRKEDRAQESLAKRGDHPGLVCILSAMELDVQTLAQQAKRQDLSCAQRWQVPALLLLFRR